MARKVRTETFDLLCGYLAPGIGDAEPILHTTCTVTELDHQTDRSLADRSSDFLGVIGRHIVAVGDIVDRDTLDKEVIPNLIKGDLDWALLKIRILSLGSDYEFSTKCVSKDCPHVTLQKLDLTTLDVVEMPDPTKRTITYRTDDGECELVFRPYFAQDLLPISDIISTGNNEIALLLGLRLISINGETPEAVARAKGRACKTAEQRATIAARMLEDNRITHRERDEIRRALDSIAGYPRLDFQARCGSCGTIWRTKMEMSPTFLMSSAVGS